MSFLFKNNDLDGKYARDIDIECKEKWRWKWLQTCLVVDGLNINFDECFTKLKKAGFASCLKCNCELNYSNRGLTTLKDHVKSDHHIRREKSLIASNQLKDFGLVSKADSSPSSRILMCDRIANQEAHVLSFLAENSLPMSLGDKIVKLAKCLSKDKNALECVKLSKTAATYKLIYGVSKTVLLELVTNLNELPFSINVDEAMSASNKKVISLLVSYFDIEMSVIRVEHLASVEILKADSATVLNAILEIFHDNNVYIDNLVSCLFDSCSVMRGKKSGVEKGLREYAPNLMNIDGDIVHHMHNIVKKFVKPFDGYLENLFRDIFNDHKWSPEQKSYLSEICHMMNIPTTNPIQYASTRWGTIYDSTVDLICKMNAYKILFYGVMDCSDRVLYKDSLHELLLNLNVVACNRISDIHINLRKISKTDEGLKRRKRIISKIWHTDLTTTLQLNFYVANLILFKQYTCVFQSGGLLVHKLHSEQTRIFIQFLSHFVKPSFISGLDYKKLTKIVFTDDTNEKYLLSDKDIFYGGDNVSIIKEAKANDIVVMDFKSKARLSYLTTVGYLQSKLPLYNGVLRCLEFIDPIKRSKSMYYLRKLALDYNLKRFCLDDSIDGLDAELLYFQTDSRLPTFELGTDPLKWWSCVLVSYNEYKCLKKIVPACLSIFSGPLVESSFSSMKNILDTKCNRTLVKLYSSIQTIRYSLRSKGETALTLYGSEKKDKHADKKLTLHMRTAYKDYKTDLDIKEIRNSDKCKSYSLSMNATSKKNWIKTSEENQRKARINYVRKIHRKYLKNKNNEFARIKSKINLKEMATSACYVPIREEKSRKRKLALKELTSKREIKKIKVEKEAQKIKEDFLKKKKVLDDIAGGNKSSKTLQMNATNNYIIPVRKREKSDLKKDETSKQEIEMKKIEKEDVKKIQTSMMSYFKKK